DARGQELNQRLAELNKSLEAAESNPLRSGKFLADLPKTLAELQSDFAGLSADLERLPDQLETERRAIVAARRQDEEQLRRQVLAEPADASALSAYLLRAEAAKPLNGLIDWLRWTRGEARTECQTQPCVTRGKDVLFAGCRSEPNFLIRAVELCGTAN